MKPRELKAILGILKRAGVAKFVSGDLAVTFQDANQPEPVQVAEDPADLVLPDGMYNPVEALKRINAKVRQ